MSLLRRKEEARYYFVRNISSGGMGQVDLILRREGSFTRLYAAKQLHNQFRDEDDFRAMFLDEARVAGLIHHPNVVSVLDFGEHETGPYLVMEYVDGVSLKDFVPFAPLPIEIVMELARQTALGLHAAHELRDAEGAPLSLVHRDVSPQNVLVGYDGLVRVTDFGIAKMYGRASKTATGVLKGKFGYMSPEQLRFEPLDRRSDLFSLGVVTYELLAGQRLYSNRDGNAPRRILHEAVPDIGMVREQLPPALVELMFELLSKDPARRPKSALEVAERLADCLAELGDETTSLGDYIKQTFLDQKEHTSSEVSKALGAMKANRLRPWPGSASAPAPAGWRIGALVALCALTAGVGAYLGTRPAPEAAPIESPPPRTIAPVMQDTPATLAVPIAEPNEPEERAPEENTPDEPRRAAVATAESEARRERARRRRARREERRRAEAPASAPAAPREETMASPMATPMAQRRWGFQGREP